MFSRIDDNSRVLECGGSLALRSANVPPLYDRIPKKKCHCSNLSAVTFNFKLSTVDFLSSLKLRRAKHQSGYDAQIHLLHGIVELRLHDLRVI